MSIPRMAALGLAILSFSPACALTPPPASVAPPKPRQADDSDLAASVPAAFEMVLELDMSRLRASPWSRPILESGSGERAAQIESLGYDEASDADRMLIAGGPGGAQLTVVQGRLDRDRVVRAFRGRHPGAVDEERHGLPVTRAADAAMAFITPRTFVAGDPEAVLAAMDCAFGFRPDMRAGAALGDLRRELTGGGGQPALRFLSVVNDEMRRQAGRDVPIPPELGRVAGRLDLGDALSFYSLGLLHDPASAERMARELRRQLNSLKVRGLAMLLGVGSLLQQVQISSQGSRVVLRLDLGAERREELAQALAGASAAVRQNARGAVP